MSPGNSGAHGLHTSSTFPCGGSAAPRRASQEKTLTTKAPHRDERGLMTERWAAGWTAGRGTETGWGAHPRQRIDF
jgi:hypothetical protein